MRRLVTLTVLLSSAPWLPGQATVSLTEEQREIFAILDAFDPLDTASLRFVRVATGNWSQTGNEAKTNSYRFGFLLSHATRRFRVRYLDQSVVTLEKTPADKPEHERVGWELADLDKHAREIAKRLAARREDPETWRHYTWPSTLFAPNAVGALVARACARAGHGEAMQLIWEQLGDTSTARRELGDGLRHRLCIDFTNPALAWADLLARHRLWQQKFPGGPDESMGKRIELLQAAADDERNAARAGREDTSMAGLVRALRNEFHPVQEYGFSSHILSTTKKKGDACPIARLRAAGLQAAPALIDALKDESLTRCVWYSSRYGGGFGVVSVGQLAGEVLSELAGLPIWDQDEWRAWWKSVTDNGERATLTGLIAKHGVAAAERLLEKWPDSLDDILTATSKVTDDHTLTALLAFLAENKDTKVTTFLHGQLNGDRPLGARVAAAEALLARGASDGVEAFKQEWKEIAARPSQERGFFAMADGRGPVAKLLLRSGDLDAIRMVTDAAMAAPGFARACMIEELRSETLDNLVQRASNENKVAASKPIEKALISLLDDARVEEGSHVSFPWRTTGVSWSNPRKCDYVACALGSLWPDRYGFDPDASTSMRDRAMLLMRNTWRKAEGLPLLEVPKPLPRLADHNAVRLWSLHSAFGDPPAALLKVAETRNGKRLDPASVLEFLIASAESLPDERGDVQLSLERPGDGTGIAVRWELQKPGGRDSTGMSWTGQADGRSLGNSSGAGVKHRYDDVTDFDRQRKAIEKALATPAGKSFEIRLTLRWR